MTIIQPNCTSADTDERWEKLVCTLTPTEDPVPGVGITSQYRDSAYRARLKLSELDNPNHIFNSKTSNYSKHSLFFSAR